MSQTVVELPPILDISHAENLRVLLLNHIQMGESLIMDGHQVTEISTACLQVLIATSAKVKGFNGVCQVIRPSSILSSACYDLGLGDFLDIEGLS